MNELDPLSAVTAADPYPYYARLVAERPFHFDEALKMWVAASAPAVEAVLASAAMRVRPPAEPVPHAIAGTAMGEIFARLVRMNDGPFHDALKPAVETVLQLADACELTAESARCANELAEVLALDDAAELNAYTFGLSASVIAALLGFTRDDASRARTWVRDFARSIAPAGAADAVAAGIPAVCGLHAALHSLRAAGPAEGSLFTALLAQGARRGIDEAIVVANAIGFFSQAYDAVAGLIGNTLIVLAAGEAALRDRVRVDAGLLEAVVGETERFDSPVQNTRRYAATDVTVLGKRVRAGDAVLVLLAAANRDPAANPDPTRFGPARAQRRTYTFGAGAHACPGARVATTIACAGIARLLASPLELRTLTTTGYHPSVNARIPLFAQP